MDYFFWLASGASDDDLLRHIRCYFQRTALLHHGQIRRQSLQKLAVNVSAP